MEGTNKKGAFLRHPHPEVKFVEETAERWVFCYQKVRILNFLLPED